MPGNICLLAFLALIHSLAFMLLLWDTNQTLNGTQRGNFPL